MEKQLDYRITLFTIMFLFIAPGKIYAYSDFGDNVNTLCAPQQPYTGSCSLCHTSSKKAPTQAKAAYLAGGSTLINYFCPAPPALICTDNDGDTFFVEGGDCGIVDCDDRLATIYPGAAEICGDGLDQDCDGVDLSCPVIPVLSPIMHLLRAEK